MRKSATIYKSDSKYVIHSEEKTTAGVGLACAPSFKLKPNAEDADLGIAIHNALDATKTNVPHPTDWKGHTAAFLKLVGAKSLSSLYRSSKCIGATEEQGNITLTPYVSDAPQRGLVPESSRARSVLRDDPAQLGALIREMFDKEA